MGTLLTRSQSLLVGIFIANLKRGDWNEKKKWRRQICNKNTNRKRLGTSQGTLGVQANISHVNNHGDIL